ncbi:DUF4231 domain-containing protein [Streptomyces sp. JJ36]|uniref:DUF4231 domain-containing protein n=1 Tax=Streptomyces sp. JJ36 TaxID=2736645 RepID=UPI001F43B675|nr:DUF4231 domain-containing protein [Streptomyces sp. JJ36]
MDTRGLALSGSHLPAMFRSADQASLSGQRDTVRWSAAQLSLLIAAAVLSATDLRAGEHLNVGDLLAAAALTGSLLPAVWLASSVPQRRWYQGRAAAESVKTLAWRYAVRAEPFTDSETADEKYLGRLEEILRSLRDLDWAPAAGEPAEITARMRRLRRAPLEVRQKVYLQGRLDDQYAWYTRRARRFGRLARVWSTAAGVTTALGLLAGFLQGFGLLAFDVLGTASAMSAAATAWVQLKQFQPQSTAYLLTSHELLLARTRLTPDCSEESWARLCGATEDAISREHTMWLARRVV